VSLLLFAAGWGANHFSTLLVVYRKNLGLSPESLGILFGAYALGLVPGLLLAGRASDRWGRRALVLPFSLVAMGASALLCFGMRGFGVLLAGRLLYGIGMGSVMSPGSVWVQELSPPGLGARRATLALSAGFGLGPLVSGLIAELLPGPMVTPYLVHVAVMAVALGRVRAVSETAPRAAATPGLGAAGAPRLADMTVLLELLPAAPWAFGFAAVTLAILPGLMRPLVAYPVIYSGLVIMTTLFVGVAVQQVVKRVGRHADLLGLGAGALAIGLGAHAAAVASPGLVFVVAGLAGVGYGFVMTSGLAEVGERVPRHARGTAVGAYYVLTYLGFALPFIHATCAGRAGDAPTLRVTAAVAVGCLLTRAGVKLHRGTRSPAPGL
jgi:MFS family permease